MQAKIDHSGSTASARHRPGRGSAKSYRRALLGLAVVAPLSAFGPAKALSATALAGDWSGEGSVKQYEGPTEKVRCRVSYKQESAKVYGAVAKCASTSKQMNQTAELLEVKPGVYVGEFDIAKFDVSGRVRVVIEGETQIVSFKSPRGEGQVTLTKR